MVLSIIIPCYNEGAKLQNNLPTIYNYLFTHTDKSISFEIIVINDGSTDNTKKILCQEIQPEIEIYKNDKFIDFKIVSYDTNKGKGYAVKQGIIHSNGKYCLFMDTDLATDLSAIQNIIRYAKQNITMIIGSRKLKESQLPVKRTFIRNFISKCSKKIINLIVPLNEISDTQCGFKAIQSDFAKNIIVPHQTINRFAFDVEYLYITKLYKNPIIEIPVIWTDDKDSKVKLAKSSIEFIKSLFFIRKNKKYYLAKN